MGVYPYVQCQMTVEEAVGHEGRLTIYAENYGDRYTIDPQDVVYDRHPMLEACVEAMQIPRGLDIEVTLYSTIPGGSSTGTSAAVTVVLIGALDLLTPGRMTPHQVAAKAHEVETKLLHQQCGIQDQLCSAFGGINFIEMHEYPHASISSLYIPNTEWWELESRMSLVFLGHTHTSSAVHEMVIRELQAAGDDGGEKLEVLRQQAFKGRDALYAGDLTAFGRTMICNTEAQEALHPALISDTAHTLFEIAQKHNAVGWKVNGAGGEGGSVSILGSASRTEQRKMLREMEAVGGGVRVIDTYLSRYGLRVWEGL